MGRGLHKLGVYAFKHPWQIIVSWAIIIAVLGFGASQLMKPTTSSISIPGTEAQKAIDRAGELFPDAGKGSGRIVFATDDGKKIDDYKAQIQSFLEETKKVDGVAGAVSPFENPLAVSGDRMIGFAQIQLDKETGSIATGTIDGITKVVDDARNDGLTVEMGGDLANNVPGEILGVGEIVGVLLALGVLVVTLGSLIAAGMPLATALVAVVVSMTGLFSLSHLIQIGDTTPVLAVMLGLAVGIDYSLFIINKYRMYRLEGYDAEAAAGRAIGTAGNAVVFAAATVVIALAALAVVQIPFMTTMGLAGAATIAIAALVAITLIPALLRFAGDAVFGRKARKTVKAAAKRGRHEGKVSHATFWYKWGHAITRRPLLVLIPMVLLIGIMAWPARELNLGLPTEEYAAHDTSERKAYDLLAKGFGAGFNAPLLVVAEGLPAVTDEDKQTVRAEMMRQFERQAAHAQAQAEGAFNLRLAAAPTQEAYGALMQEAAAMRQQGEQQKAAALAQIEQNVNQYAKLAQLKKIADKVAALDNVEKALPAMATDNGTAGAIQVIPKTGPSDPKTSELISYLRNSAHQKELADGRNVGLAVTGSTALQLDINAKLAAALPLYLGVVVGLSLLLLIVAFRSILVPLKATLGFLLSVMAMFGAMVAVFQWGWFGITDAPGPIVSFIPIIAIGVLFGLAMDYEFFLVSGIHESYARSKDAKKAVVDGFGLGSKVVTAAAFIMVAVFAGFVTNHQVAIQAIGFGLAVGIFVDAFIVRMLIVPAVMTLLGKSAWWLPKWLDRILPHVSIEGEETKKR